MRKSTISVARRNECFADKVVTKIWYEQPSAENPYNAQRAFCQGYDLFELAKHCDYWEYLYVLFTGDRPSPDQRDLLRQLAILASNVGPRHPATRAAMTAAVSKTDASHILPIGLNVLGGDYLGAAQVSSSMRFLRRGLRQDPTAMAGAITSSDDDEPSSFPAPGFGSRYAGLDELAQASAAHLLACPGAGTALAWGAKFAAALGAAGQGGWLMTGVVAAALLDLGFHPKWGVGLYQMLCVPGLLAHGMEMTGKPLTAMPFIDDDRYFIDD